MTHTRTIDVFMGHNNMICLNLGMHWLYCQLMDCGVVLDQKMNHVCSKNLSTACITYACTYAINIGLFRATIFFDCAKYLFQVKAPEQIEA